MKRGLLFSIADQLSSQKNRQVQCMESNVMMYGLSSKETDNDSSTVTSATTPINQWGRIRKVDCAIIGAGAAGLQCAAILLENRKTSVSSSTLTEKKKTLDYGVTRDSEDEVSLIVVEARDRIGGRILTTHEKIITVGPEDPAEVSLYRDHGAAWVHGAHDSNPMIHLLSDTDTKSSSTSDLPEVTTDEQLRVLNPVFDGNPWIRPHTVLHRNGKKGGNSLISFFIDGTFVPDSTVEIDQGEENIPEGVRNDQSNGPTSSQASLSSLAIQRHYRLLREIVSKYNSDDYNFGYNDNVDQLYKELNSSFEDLSTPTEEKHEDEERLISLLTPFYLYLMENWNGISMKDTNVEQVVELFEYFGDEEEKEGDNKHSVMPKTDEQYVSAGDFIGPHCKVKTGMFTVLKPLIKIIEEYHEQQDNSIICLGEEVVSVIDKKTHVRIEMASGNIIEAKCCVSTIPLGCLQHSVSMETDSVASTRARKSFFQPRLRNDKIEAINSIWSGSYKKVFLTFDHIFWPKEPPIIGLVRGEPIHEADGPSLTLPGRYLLLYNLWARDRDIPSIEAILCGDLGKWAFQKSDSIIQQAVIKFIEAAMGVSNLMASCIACHVTRWEEDEFTRGSYSAFQLGTLDRHVDVLGSTEWDGRLVFAGEATENDHMGSVHAALFSGKRAAKQVLDFLPSSDAK